jgi:hypothetical protein
MEEGEKKAIEVAPYLLSSMILPGSGQFLMGHKAKGTVVFCTEALLLGSGANDGFYLTHKRRQEVNRVKARMESPFAMRDTMFLGASASSESLSLVDSLDYFQGEFEYSESILQRTLVWGAGFHIYNLLDCYRYFTVMKDAPGKETERSAKGAIVRSFLIPGWGQLYNHEYSKLGLILMATAGFSMNIYVWNRTGDYYAGLQSRYRDLADPLLDRIQALQAQDSSGTNAVDTALQEANRDLAYLNTRKDRYNEESKRYYSDRNQNVWFLLAVYLYAAFDAYVDAHLSGFERKLEFGLAPAPQGLKFSVKTHFK